MKTYRFQMMRRLLFSLLILSILMPAPQGFAAPEEVATYNGLLQAIRAARTRSQARIEQAVEQEKVREAWETGKLIDEHILQHKERAGYGEQVLKRLSEDLKTSQTELSYMLQFARAYPIYPAPDKLSWSHYRELLSLNDSKEREEVTEQAVREHWSSDQVRQEVRRRRLSEGSEETPFGPPPLKAQKGTLDTYRIVTLEGRPVISLGFSNYLELSRRNTRRFKEGDIVRISKGRLKPVKRATESLVPLQIFSYRAKALEITDGDTFWALVDLGFGFTTRQHLRLRGLDAPEIESKEGKEAKEWLTSVIASPGGAKQSPVTITASRSDKYDRYLADVWVGETYINQELIDKGLAVRVNE